MSMKKELREGCLRGKPKRTQPVTGVSGHVLHVLYTTSHELYLSIAIYGPYPIG